MRCNAYFTHHVISCGQVPHILRRHSPCMHMGHFRQVQNLTAKDVAFCKDERHERAMRRSPGKSDCRIRHPVSAFANDLYLKALDCVAERD